MKWKYWAKYTYIEDQKRYIIVDENFGLSLTPLLEIIIENGFNITLICEAPLFRYI